MNSYKTSFPPSLLSKISVSLQISPVPKEISADVSRCVTIRINTFPARATLANHSVFSIFRINNLFYTLNMKSARLSFPPSAYISNVNVRWKLIRNEKFQHVFPFSTIFSHNIFPRISRNPYAVVKRKTKVKIANHNA